jgi:hypothetical protein
MKWKVRGATLAALAADKEQYTVFIPHEQQVCKNCRYYSADDTTGYAECANEVITETELDKHYSGNVPGCPYFVLQREIRKGGKFNVRYHL